MIRLLLTVFLVFGLSLPASARDASLEKRYAAALQAGGFSVRTIGYTFWGRLRIVATLDGMEREIIINPNTGEVLRDQTRPIALANSEGRGDGSTIASISPGGAAIGADGDAGFGVSGGRGDEGEVPVLTSPEVIEGTHD